MAPVTSDRDSLVMRAWVVAAAMALAPTLVAAQANCGKMPCALDERLSGGFKDGRVDLRGVCDKWARQSNPQRASSGPRRGRRLDYEDATQLVITLVPGSPRDLAFLRQAGVTVPAPGPLLLPAGAITAAKVRALARSSVIASIEPDCPLGQSADPEGQLARGCPDASRWSAQAIGLPQLKPAPVKTWVAIMDSGLHCRHPDLQPAIAMANGSSFPPVPDNGLPCPCVYGSDFVEGDDMPNECAGFSECNHGTSMAGVIGGRGIMVTGVNPRVGMRSVRVLLRDNKVFDRTTKLSDLAKSILFTNGLGADVINISWTAKWDARALRDAIAKVASPQAPGPRPSLVVAAVANTGKGYPGDSTGLDNLLTVAAVEVNSDLSVKTADFRHTSVDKFVAPARAHTTIPPDQAACEYGTSVAAAYVSGAASRVMADPRLAQCTPAEIKEILLCTTTEKPLTDSDTNEHVNLLSLEFLKLKRLRDHICANGHSWPDCVPKT